MAYRPTEKTEARKAALKQRLLDAALFLVSSGGFNSSDDQCGCAEGGHRNRRRLQTRRLEGGVMCGSLSNRHRERARRGEAERIARGRSRYSIARHDRHHSRRARCVADASPMR